MTKTVEVTEKHDIRESRRRMVSFKPGTTVTTTDARAQKVVDAGKGQLVDAPKADAKAADTTTAKAGTGTTTHANVKG